MFNDTQDRWTEFNEIVDEENLDSKEKLILLVLFRYVNAKTKYANPSRALIKKLTSIQHDQTLDKHLNSLIDKGYLDRVSGNGNRSKYYIRIPLINEVPIKIEAPTKSDGIPPIKNRGIVPIKIDGQKEKENKRKENIYIDLKFIDDVIDKVKITQDQYDKLVIKFNKAILHNNIIALDNYVANGKGNKYKEHYRVLNTWCSKEKPIRGNYVEDRAKTIL